MKNQTRNWPVRGSVPGTSEDESRRCAECHREISIGEDAIALERIVMGPRGPVPIDDMKFFHVSRCLADYFCNSDGEKLPARIP